MQRRAPVQLITLADSKEQAIDPFPFLDPARTRVYSDGFSEGCLHWIAS